MKKLLATLMMASLALSGFAKEIKSFVVTPTPQMHCSGCENKIKNGLKFEKGVKDITTSIPDQTVTIKYDADKTSAKELTEAFQKMGYTITVIKDEKVAKGNKKSKK